MVSVVFRGALWLDGVATCVIEAREPDCNLKISKLIKSSKQFSQLHAVILSRRLLPNRKISIERLAGALRLPVIAIKRIGRPRTRNANYLDMAVGGRHILVAAAGFGKEETESVYRIACSPSATIPEAVRVADLLAEQLNRTVGA